MLALKSCIQKSGFSLMDADELYFINGGCGEGANNNTNSVPVTVYEYGDGKLIWYDDPSLGIEILDKDGKKIDFSENGSDTPALPSGAEGERGMYNPETGDFEEFSYEDTSSTQSSSQNSMNGNSSRNSGSSSAGKN